MSSPRIIPAPETPLLGGGYPAVALGSEARARSLHVAVAIVGFRNAEDVFACLNALGRSTYTDFEVVICENGGSAAFARLTSGGPQVLAGGQAVTFVLASSNLGYAGGINTCIGLSRTADAIWVLNPDTVPEPGAMAAMVARLSGGCDAVGSVVYFPGGIVESYGGQWCGWLGAGTSLGFGAAVDEPIEPGVIERKLSYVSGASMMVSRRFIQTVGPMREDYFLYCEELEWFLRGANCGMRLGLAADAKVMHNQGSSTGSVAKFKDRPRLPVYLDTRNKLLMTRDLTPNRLPVVAFAVIVHMGLRCLRRGAWRQMGFALAGWRAGLLNERGPPAWLSR